MTIVDKSWFTDEGREDYAAACAEIAAQRNLQKSPYANVFRLHCIDGYVDFICTRSVLDANHQVARQFGIPVPDVNGYDTGKRKDEVIAFLNARRITIHDIY